MAKTKRKAGIKSTDKLFKTINKWLVTSTELLTNVLTFAIICGLLFNDPFGVIGIEQGSYLNQFQFL